MFLTTVISRPETLRRVVSAGMTDPSASDFGFLRNPRRFCVAVSRAQALNVVVRADLQSAVEHTIRCL